MSSYRSLKCRGGSDFIRPHTEALKGIGTKRRGDRDVCRISPSCNENPSNARDMVSRVKSVPMAIEIRFKPGRKVAGRIGRLRADFTEISRAVTGRNIECSTECYGQVSIVSTDSLTFLVSLGSCPCRARKFVAERDALMHKISNGLHAVPTWPRSAELGPRQVQKFVAVAEAAWKKKDDGFIRKQLYRNLGRIRSDGIGKT